MEEQKRIESLLTRTDTITHRLIRAKQRLIELLKEQKQAIIHQAVTCGLDPDIPMKPTGLDWLPEVPEHWEGKPLKRWAAINDRVLPETTDSEYVFRYLDIGAVGTGFLTEQPELMRFENAPSRARRGLRRGDTIISTVRTYLKAVYFVEDEQEDLVASTGFAVLTPVPGIVPEYLSFVIQSNAFIERVVANSVGIAYPAIAETSLEALHLALPPTQREQLSLVEYIKGETQNIDEAIRRAQREIDLIREYRTRLISDVVTGKLDVREVELPEAKESEYQPGLDRVPESAPNTVLGVFSEVP
jgi:type I restriction enzyme S subunit